MKWWYNLQNVVGRSQVLMVPCQVQIIQNLILTTRYLKICPELLNATFCFSSLWSKMDVFVFQQLCIWYITVEEGQVITLSFRNFSLETQDVCDFDYVEVYDSYNTGSGRILGRYYSLNTTHLTFHLIVKFGLKKWFLDEYYVQGFVGAPLPQTWSPLAPIWRWCLWLMMKSLIVASL